MLMASDAIRRRYQLTGLVFALVFPSLMTWVYFVALSGRREAGVAYLIGKIVQFGFPLVWLRWVEGRWFRLARPSIKGLALASIFGAFVVALMLTVYLAGLRGSPMLAGAASEIRHKLEPFGLATPVGFLLLAAFYCVAHSLLEEYYWRWYVFGRLRDQTHPALAALISSLGFMAHHVILVYRFIGGSGGAVILFSLSVAGGGAVWAWIYHRNGSLYGPWWSHGMVDAALMLIGYDLLGGL
jgi:hypothetical protein